MHDEKGREANAEALPDATPKCSGEVHNKGEDISPKTFSAAFDEA